MKATPQTLNVYWNQDIVGQLWNDPEGSLHFTYDASWLAHDRRPISLSMPLRKEAYQKEARAFFGNLLPEGDFRRRDLGRIVRSEGLAGLGTAGHLNRLSLAGAQGKLPVRMRDNALAIPLLQAACMWRDGIWEFWM